MKRHLQSGRIRVGLTVAAVLLLGLSLSACWVFDNPVDPAYSGGRTASSGSTSSSGSGTSSSGGLTFDTTAPTAGGGGVLSTSMPGPDTVHLSWAAATDNSTAQSKIQYEVVVSPTPLTTIAQAEAATIVVPWTSNITSANATITSWDNPPGSPPPSTHHYFGVLDRDLAGNVGAYSPATRKVYLNDIVAVVANSSGTASPGTHVFLNDGNGKFSTPVGGGVLDVAGSGYTNLALGNLTSHPLPADGGGSVNDIFVTNNNVSPNEVWANNGNGSFSQLSESFPTAPSNDVALGPIFAAGETDAFVANSGAASTVWRNSTGNGAFTMISQANLSLVTTDTPTAVAMANITGTSAGGAGDVLLANNGQTNRVWQYSSTISAYSAYTESAFISGSYTRDVAIADLNGDGLPDAFVANYGSGGSGQQNYVYLNTNSAGVYTFSTPWTVGPSNSPSTAVALGDLNGDGTIDAFVVNSGSPDTVWSNDGTGVFTQIPEPNFAGMVDQGTGVALGDLNGDGILDAVVSSGGSTGRIRVFLGNGDGTFTEVPEPNIPTGNYVAVAIGRLR